MEPDQREIPVRPRRRFAGVALGFVAPGLGHFAIGRLRRGLAWYGLCVLTGCATIAAGLAARPWLMWFGLATGVAILLSSPFDTLRLQRPEKLPRSLWVVVVLGVVAVIQISAAEWVKASGLEAFKLKGQGNQLALEAGDHFVVAKFPKAFRRSELVALRSPHTPGRVALLRVIGLGGDTVKLRAREVVLNGHALPRRRLAETRPHSHEGDGCAIWEEDLDGKSYRVATDESVMRPRDFGPVKVPEGQVFLLGDSRDASSDSRAWGPLPLDSVIGRAAFIWWSSGPEGVRWERINTVIR